jgi:hypothetical protein
MTAIPRFLSHTVPAIPSAASLLETIAMVCVAGLLVFACVATYGLDISAGFF